MLVQDQIREITRAFDEGTLDEMRYLLRALEPVEAAHLLEATPPRLRQVIWELLTDEEQRNQTLSLLGEDVRAEFLSEMDTDELAAVAEVVDTDDFADILQQLPDTIARQVLAVMDARDRERVEQVLSYPEDSAGGLMDTDTITVRPRHTLELVLRYLRRFERLPNTTDSLIVTNANDEYIGLLPLTRLLTTDPSVTVREVMVTDVPPIPATASDTEVARLFAEQDLVSAPVVDDNGVLLGRITIDDVVDVIIEDAEDAYLGQGGLDADEDLFAPITRAARSRAVWLGINLATAFMAAAVINLFEDTIARVVALAVLMPIVASMGGIAGTQTLTLVVRGMALGQVGGANLRWLLNRELLVAALNGVVWSLLVAAAAALIFKDAQLGMVIAVAIVANMLIAAVSGSLLPMILTALRIDPAIAGGVVLTTITDVSGFFIFLGLATLVYA